MVGVNNEANISLSKSYNDDKSKMTYGRRIALWLAKHCKGCYYPKASEHETNGFDLDDGWAYFEHVSLGRYVEHFPEVGKGSMFSSIRSVLSRRDHFVNATVGDNSVATRLYPIFYTGEEDLADFGIGVGLYFSHLKNMVYIFLVAFLVNLWSVLYYRSSDYDAANQSNSTIIWQPLSGTAACLSHEWQPCPTCTESDWDDFPSTGTRFASKNNGEEKLNFILKSNCNFEFDRALPAFISACFIFVAFAYVIYLEGKKKVKFDEAQQTTSDYSIAITNPPPDARDPNEWRKFVLHVAESHEDKDPQNHLHRVTCCTVVLNNETLVRTLAQRASLMVKFENMLPPNKSFQDIDIYDLSQLTELSNEIPEPSWWKKCFCTSASSVVGKIADLDQQIEELSNVKYDVCDVFITFEREETQRQVLKRLSHGTIYKKIAKRYKFRNEITLDVIEPAEPSSIRYEDIDDSLFVQLIRLIISITISFAVVFFGAYLVFLSKRDVTSIWYGFSAPALTIMFLNIVTPIIVRNITNFESHRNEGRRQTSLYLKLLAFRCVNTAIVLYIITPPSDTTSVDGGLLALVYSLFQSEFLITPFLQLSDYMGHFKRHYLGPRAVDRRRMFNCFTGTKYDIADRYTSMSKMIYLALFYSSVFPTAYAYAALALFIFYWTDKIALLRTWGLAPNIGPEISVLNDLLFLPCALLSYAIVSGYFLSGFPYDNSCEDPNYENVPALYVGSHTIVTRGGDSVNVTISGNEATVYKFCSQVIETFPLFSSAQGEDRWMTDGQETLVDIYAIASLVVIAVFVVYVLSVLKVFLTSLVKSTYKPKARLSGRRYSEVSGLSAPAYVPLVRIAGMVYPMLLSDLGELTNKRILGFDVPNRRVEDYNLIYGVKSLRELMKKGIATPPNPFMFSIFKYWDPEDSVEEQEEAKEEEWSPTEGTSNWVGHNIEVTAFS